MQAQEIHAAIRTVKREIARWPDPVVGVVARQSGRDPFLVLISCLLSLRTKDKTTAEASERLFALASTPATMQTLTIPVIERAIYPVGFYRTKSKQIQQICAQLGERYHGRVPDKIEELLTLPQGRRRRIAYTRVRKLGKSNVHQMVDNLRCFRQLRFPLAQNLSSA